MATDAKIKTCSRPGCRVVIKPGQLACRGHWFELPAQLRDQLIEAWELRKANPTVPELVHAHRALLIKALRAWNVPVDLVSAAMARAPHAYSHSCPYCGGVGGLHLLGCERKN